jgi:hypothetical protein
LQAKGDNSYPIYGEALAFFGNRETNQLLVVAQPIIGIKKFLGVSRGKLSPDIHILPASALQDIIGILVHYENYERVYIEKRHPGLDMLSAEECEASIDDEEETDVM